MVVEYQILGNELKPEMVRFMGKVDFDFKPPLKGRADLSELIDKVLSNGYCYVALGKGEIIGAIMFYCNDLGTKVAYINYYAVLNNYRKNGIGSKLIDFSFKKSLAHGMEKIGVHTWKSNEGTIKIYYNKGFVFKDHNVGLNGDKVYLEKTLV